MMIADYDHDYENDGSQNIPSDDDGSRYISANPKKRKKNLNQREVNKRNNVAGLERQSARKIDGEFKMFPAKPRRDEHCKCSCKMKLTDVEKESIYKQFRGIKYPEAQRTLLRGLTSICGTNKKGNIYEHRLNLPYKTIKVCQKYWLGIFGMTSRGSIMSKVLDQSTSPSDGRGCHTNHPKMDPKCKASIRRFIGTFPCRASHYSRHDNPDRKYLDAHLSIAELHRIYLALHPEFAEKVKYDYFNSIFNKEFNLTFSSPRSDICESCDDYHKKIAALKISGTAEDIRNDEQELKNHWVEAEAFYNKLKEVRKCTDPSKVALCIDFEKQQPIPKTSIGPEFYKSQLMLQTFCIENVKTGESSFYLYPENFSQKGSEEVVAFLKDFIEELPPATKELSLWCDNCGGQNKNRNVFSFMQNLANSGRFEKVTIHFPVPGHSRLPCDRIFGILQKHLSKFEKIIQPSDYISCIKKCKMTKPIRIKYVNFPFTNDLKDDGNEVVLVKAFESKLNELLRPTIGNIQKIRSMIFTPNAHPIVSYSVQEIEYVPLLLFRENVLPELLDAVFTEALPKQTEYLKIPRNKYQCVQYLLKSQIIPESTTFFTSLYPDPDDIQVTKDITRSRRTKGILPSTEAAIIDPQPSISAATQLRATKIDLSNATQQRNITEVVSMNNRCGAQNSFNTVTLESSHGQPFNAHQFSIRPQAQLRNTIVQSQPFLGPPRPPKALKANALSPATNILPQHASIRQGIPCNYVPRMGPPRIVTTPVRLPGSTASQQNPRANSTDHLTNNNYTHQFQQATVSHQQRPANATNHFTTTNNSPNLPRSTFQNQQKAAPRAIEHRYSAHCSQALPNSTVSIQQPPAADFDLHLPSVRDSLIPFGEATTEERQPLPHPTEHYTGAHNSHRLSPANMLQQGQPETHVNEHLAFADNPQ